MKNPMWGTGIVALLFTLVIASCAHYEPPQKEEACPLPTGVKPLDPPRVTAQQVEDGSASLMDFALAVREQLRRGTESPEEWLYIGCLFREETSPWFYGDTYLVTLTHNGRVWDHSKDMSYSGRLLKPEIYRSILQTLGINPADLADLATAIGAFNAAASRDGGEFNLTTIPNASGYAVVSIENTEISPVLIVGFDVDESHLVQEQIDIGAPAVTASEVVNRETLKAFVTEAGERILEIFATGSPSVLAETKVAFRDLEGPWRHGSVYLYVLDITSNIIVFHGAFPNRYENRPLVPTARDAITGELILPQVLEAAKSNPEGGFVEYHFDDPTDPNDSHDTPKVGYARQFSVMVGPGTTLDFIVGSGFYPDTTDRN